MMTDNRTSNNVNPIQKRLPDRVAPQSVARLLGITLDAKHDDERDSDEAMVELLGARLNGVWLPNNGREGAWARLVRQLLCKRGSQEPRTIGGLLLDSQTTLDTIRLVRDRAKAQAARESREAEHAVMTMIYFAAIANALAYHRTKITTYSCESLASSFEKLTRKTWIPADFVELFQRAGTICREKPPRPWSQ